MTATEACLAREGAGPVFKRSVRFATSTTAGVRRLSVLYVGTLTRPRDMSANATLALYRTATGASLLACATLTGGNATLPAVRRDNINAAVTTICASRRKFDSRTP